jgi:hypothetical protein
MRNSLAGALVAMIGICLLQQVRIFKLERLVEQSMSMTEQYQKIARSALNELPPVYITNTFGDHATSLTNLIGVTTNTAHWKRLQ